MYAVYQKLHNLLRDAVAVCLSVHVSITSRYFVNTAQDVISQAMPTLA